MPPDPKKPIEDLLEASARARRAQFGAEPKMPNPMRARLHDEIARLGREDQPRERRSWLALFWPQISIAAGVLVTASVLWLGYRSNSGSESTQLARRVGSDAQPEAALRSQDASKQVAAKAESASDESFHEGAVASGSFAENTAKQPSVETRDQAGSTALQKFADVALAPAAPVATERSDANEIAQALAANAPSGNLASAEGAARASSFKKEADTGNLQQQFSQTARGQALRSDAKLKQAANVLNTFQVEQDGRQIRVVDEDGSTYTGKLEATAHDAARSRVAKTSEPNATSTVMGGKDSATSENELYFRATGYNTSLKKQVVFEGNYIAPPTTAQASNLKKDEQTPARIVGTARVPGESPVAVDAIAVAR